MLNHSGMFNASFLVSGMNNLLLAKEHISQWKPHLVIADLYSFLSDPRASTPIFMSCNTIPVILLQSGDREHIPAYDHQYTVHSVLSKRAALNELLDIIQDALHIRATLDTPKNVTPLLTPQEEKVLSQWMDGMGNKAIAAALGIHSKTVYTYKRNIRMKLHLGNRFSPFLSLPENKN